MSDLFFRYRPVDVEIGYRRQSDDVPIRELGRQMMSVSGEHGPRLEPVMTALCDQAKTEDDEAYVRHSIRLASALLVNERAVNTQWLHLALSHNVRECQTFVALEETLNDEMRDALASLTIDREQERDPEYLARYYDRLAAAPSTLMVLKGYDKLDSFLSYAYAPIEDPYYAAVLVEQVCPRLAPVHPELAKYLLALAQFVWPGDGDAT